MAKERESLLSGILKKDRQTSGRTAPEEPTKPGTPNGTPNGVYTGVPTSTPTDVQTDTSVGTPIGTSARTRTDVSVGRSAGPRIGRSVDPPVQAELPIYTLAEQIKQKVEADQVSVEGFISHTIKIRPSVLSRLKTHSTTKGRRIQDVIDDALSLYFEAIGGVE